MNTQTRAILDDLKHSEEARKEAARNTPHARYARLMESEGNFLDHMTRWGSAGYPIQKLAGKWFWVEAFAVTGTPSPFKTKKAGHEAIEQYLDFLRDKLAGRI